MMSLYEALRTPVFDLAVMREIVPKMVKIARNFGEDYYTVELSREEILRGRQTCDSDETRTGVGQT